MLAMSKIPLEWADNQYLVTLLAVVSAQTRMMKKPQKKKVGVSDMGRFIRKGD